MGKRKRTRSHNWHGPTHTRRVLFLVRSMAGRWYEVHPRLFLLHMAYGRLVQRDAGKQEGNNIAMRALVADGYDVYPDRETGALRLHCVRSEVSYPIAPSWRWVERNFIYDQRAVTQEQRQQAIDEDCLFVVAPEPVRTGSHGWQPLVDWLSAYAAGTAGKGSGAQD